MAVTYLYRYRESRGVHDYLCNELYKLSDADLETFMPQVCNLLVFHARDSPGLERFVMDKCADSMHMALQVFWFLQAAVEDAARATNRTTEARVKLLRTRCETAAVNGSKHAMLAAAAQRISAATLIAADVPFSSRKEVAGNALFPSSSAGDLMLEETRRQVVSEGEEEGGDVKEAEDIKAVSCTEGGGENGEERNDEEENGEEGNEKQEKEGRSIEIDGVALALRSVEIAHGTEVARSNSTPDIVGENRDVRFVSEVVEKAGLKSEMDDDPFVQQSAKMVSKKADSDREQETIDPNSDFDPVTLLTMKKERFDYFSDSISIAREFIRLSLTTKDLPQDQRQAHLRTGLEKINDIILRRMNGDPGIPLIEDSPVPAVSEMAEMGLEAALRSVHLPLTRASSQALRILRVHSEEVVILTSRTRAPYLVNIEVLPTNMLCSDKLLFCEQRVMTSPEPEEAPLSSERPPKTPRRYKAEETHPKNKSSEKVDLQVEDEKIRNMPDDESSVTKSARKLSDMTPAERQRANVRKVVYGDAYSRQPEVFSLAEESYEKGKCLETANNLEQKARQAVILSVYGELWSWKEERILSKSPFKNLEGTRLMPFIVKAGDDLRQEQLAIQLISQFKKIFDEEGVNVFLRPFTVMSVSSEAGFVEVIPDAISVHSLKKRAPNFLSLLDYFEKVFGQSGTRSFRAAQRRFIRSMAGYSLVTYFLQIKDRHNGNIMIDVHGRIIHIDFGFMLTNSPGAIKFESVPFKLTEEYLQVICAKKNVQDLAEASKTEGYRYFQELFVMGLLAARKHYEKITTLVEIMTEGTTMPCMTGGHSIVESLRSRFAVGMPEEHCINFALGLIEESRLSWRSAGYDRFQAYSNGYR